MLIVADGDINNNIWCISGFMLPKIFLTCIAWKADSFEGGLQARKIKAATCTSMMTCTSVTDNACITYKLTTFCFWSQAQNITYQVRDTNLHDGMLDIPSCKIRYKYLMLLNNVSTYGQQYKHQLV